jgi:hypothetical protein
VPESVIKDVGKVVGTTVEWLYVTSTTVVISIATVQYSICVHTHCIVMSKEAF